MDNANCIDYHQSNSFSKIFLDYIDEKTELRSFYNYSPELNSLTYAIANKQKENTNREVLVTQLLNQYSTSGISINANVKENINLLKSHNTFTITTGHQLAIFTGEWYFIFKIMTAISMAKEAKQLHPEYNFVPVFWMASEDHDFEEINHIHLSGHTFEWKENASGPAGRIKTDSIETLLDSLKHFLHKRPYAEELISIFKEAYKNGNTLSKATRYLVHELFKEEGLIILDADNIELKKTWAPFIKKEISEQISFDACTIQTEALEKLNYSSQIFPREINMFYILDGYRERIIKENNIFKTNDQQYEFSEEEIISEIDNHPERFSPNVVLRPLYQESILPNLCYIGGPGEIAYWLQLKTVFEKHAIQYPILAWRNSFVIAEEKEISKWENLGFEVEEIFKKLNDLENEYVSKHQTKKINLEEEQVLLKNYIEKIKTKAVSVDDNLKFTLQGTEKRILHIMERIEYKIWKAEKRKFKTELAQIAEIKSTYFPKGKLQERYDNFSLWYSKYGKMGMEKLQNSTNPLKKEIKILKF